MENIPIPNNTVTGLIIATFIGILMKWIERQMQKSSEHFSEAAQIRKELREQINTLMQQLQEEKEKINFCNSK